MDCVLCSILEREQDRIVYQDESVFVCMNHAPLKQGHLMVLPKRHAERLNDLTAEESVAYNVAVERAMETVKSWCGSEVLMSLNGWEYRSQTHLHVHIVPATDGIRGYFAKKDGVPQNERSEDKQLALLAQELSEHFLNSTID